MKWIECSFEFKLSLRESIEKTFSWILFSFLNHQFFILTSSRSIISRFSIFNQNYFVMMTKKYEKNWNWTTELIEKKRNLATSTIVDKNWRVTFFIFVTFIIVLSHATVILPKYYVKLSTCWMCDPDQKLL